MENAVVNVLLGVCSQEHRDGRDEAENVIVGHSRANQPILGIKGKQGQKQV